MKKFNLSEIMKRAHNLYNNARAKYPTFSEALKRSWKMAKFDAMRAAAETKAEIGVFMKSEEKNSIQRVDIRSIVELDEILCDVVCRIAGLSSSILSACVVDEIDKEINNRLNIESHVSE